MFVYTDFILQHFTRISHTSHDFLSLLAIDDLIDLIVDDELNVTSEEITWEAIVRWIDYEYAARAKFAPNLLRRMRLGLLSTEYFLSKALFMSNLVIIISILIIILTYFLLDIIQNHMSCLPFELH